MWCWKICMSWRKGKDGLSVSIVKQYDALTVSCNLVVCTCSEKIPLWNQTYTANRSWYDQLFCLCVCLYACHCWVWMRVCITLVIQLHVQSNFFLAHWTLDCPLQVNLYQNFSYCLRFQKQISCFMPIWANMLL